jgi:hypothetical protein
MTIVEFGTNRFVDCRALVGFRGRHVVAVASDPLQVSLRVPIEGSPDTAGVEVENGNVVRGDGITITADRGSFAIYSNDVLIAVALRRSDEVVYLKLDLRPLGVEMFDDAEGLHIGTNTLAQNEFKNAATAIALG